MEYSAEVIEADNACERWVVDFGPVTATEPKEGEQNRRAIFVFGTGQRTIEAAIGAEVERNQVAAILAQFVPFFTLGVEAQEDELLNNRYGKFMQ